jgi:hypothetical protein
MVALEEKGGPWMNYVARFLVVTVSCLAGYAYDAPLTQEHSILVDSSILGLWEWAPDNPVLILKYSDTEYLIRYELLGDVYVRAYPISIGDISCVQLQFIGSENGPPEKEEKDLFSVVSYLLEDGELEVKTINTELVDEHIEDSEALRKAFLKHRDNSELFTDFVRLKQSKR